MKMDGQAILQDNAVDLELAKRYSSFFISNNSWYDNIINGIKLRDTTEEDFNIIVECAKQLIYNKIPIPASVDQQKVGNIGNAIFMCRDAIGKIIPEISDHLIKTTSILIAKGVDFSHYADQDYANIGYVVNDVILENGRTKVHLGDFRVTMYRNLRIKVRGCGNNQEVGNHIHPHVDIGGNFCWGMGARAYEECREECNPIMIFELAESILRTYNPDSPYVNLERYAGFHTCLYCEEFTNTQCSICNQYICKNHYKKLHFNGRDQNFCIRCITTCSVCGKEIPAIDNHVCIFCHKTVCKNCGSEIKINDISWPVCLEHAKTLIKDIIKQI